MSEVKLNIPAISTGHPDAGRVYAAAYEAAVVAHDAQRLRADTAEAERDALRYKAELYDEVWADATGRGYANVTMALCALAAAEQRIAELTRALAGMLFAFDDGVGRDWSAPLLDYARKLTNAAEFDAAINPNPEAESHE